MHGSVKRNTIRRWNKQDWIHKNMPIMLIIVDLINNWSPSLKWWFPFQAYNIFPMKHFKCLSCFKNSSNSSLDFLDKVTKFKINKVDPIIFQNIFFNFKSTNFGLLHHYTKPQSPRSELVSDCTLNIRGIVNTLVFTSKTYLMYSFCFREFITFHYISTTLIHKAIHKQTHKCFNTNVHLYCWNIWLSTIPPLWPPMLYVFSFLLLLLLPISAL